MKYGMLTPIKKIGIDNSRSNAVWLFRCDCGRYKEAIMNNVKRGLCRSCGCMRYKWSSEKSKTHGFISKFKKGNKNPKFYSIWAGMKQRCNYKKNYSYKYYGARGIKVCKRWNNFRNFYGDMYKSFLIHREEFGEKQTTIDRISNDGNYEPNNCRWATRKEQGRNKKTNHIIYYNGSEMVLARFLEKYKIDKSKYYRRIKKGIKLSDIVSELGISLPEPETVKE